MMNFDLSTLTPEQLIQLQKTAEQLVSEDQKYFIRQKEHVQQARESILQDIARKDHVESLRNNMIALADIPRSFEVVDFKQPRNSGHLSKQAFFSEASYEAYWDVYRQRNYSNREEIDQSKYCEVYNETLQSDKDVAMKVVILKDSVTSDDEGKYTAFGVMPVQVGSMRGTPSFEFGLFKFTWVIDETGAKVCKYSKNLKDFEKGKKTLSTIKAAFKKIQERWSAEISKNYSERYTARVNSLRNSFIAEFNERPDVFFKIVLENQTSGYGMKARFYSTYNLVTPAGIKLAGVKFQPNEIENAATMKLPTEIEAALLKSGSSWTTGMPLTNNNLNELIAAAKECDAKYLAYKNSMAAVKAIIDQEVAAE